MKQLLVFTTGTTQEFLYSDLMTERGISLTVCHSATEVFYKLKTQYIDLVILDVNESVSGYGDLLLQLVKSTSKPIMVFAQTDEPNDHIRVLEAGADDYVIKGSPAWEIIARIDVCLRKKELNKPLIRNSTLDVNGISLCMNHREVTSRGMSIAITGLEFELLFLLMSNAGEIVSRDDIGKCIFNRHIVYCDKSVNMHISNLRKKLKQAADLNMIKTIRGSGYMFH